MKTFIEYQRQFIRDVIGAGGIPVVATMTPKGDNWDLWGRNMIPGDEYKFVEFARRSIANLPGQAAVIDHYNVRAARASGHHMKYRTNRDAVRCFGIRKAWI